MRPNAPSADRLADASADPLDDHPADRPAHDPLPPTRPDRRRFLAGAAASATALVLPALPIAPARAEPGRDERQMLDDWPWLSRYDADDRRLIASGLAVDTVFLGDSITEGWPRARPDFFPARRISRGISGQTTPQMVLRMPANVLRLKPKRLHLLAGTNDIAGNTGPSDDDAIVGNLAMMIAVAQDAGIEVLLGAIPPAAAFWWRPESRPAARIVALNRRLADLARTRRCEWLDYHRALDDGEDGLRTAFSDDGVHPNAAGYAAMEALCGPRLAAPTKRARTKRR